MLAPGKLFQLGVMFVAKAREPRVEHLKGASLRPEYRHAECSVFIVMLIVIMVNVVMMNVVMLSSVCIVMLSVILLNFIMLSVVVSQKTLA